MTDDTRKWWALAAVGSGVLMSTIDGSIVNIALRSLVNAFNSDLGVVEWVILSYLLSITCLLLMMGRLGDMMGKRRIYIAGFAIFTLASALCGFAPTIGALIGFRVLQGVGAAMLQALGPGLLVLAFPAKERGMALGFIGSTVAMGILIGPAMGGFLLNTIGWEAIFFVNIPIGLFGIWVSLRSLPHDNIQTERQKFDIPGALLLLFGLLCFLLGLTEGSRLGWDDPRILGLFVSAFIGGALFIWQELRAPQPMLNLTIFRKAAFSLNLLAVFVLFCALSFNLLLTPLLLQLVYLLDLQTTGLVLISLPLTLSMAAPISGWLSDRIGARLLTMMGLAVVTAGFLGMSAVRTDTPLLVVIGLLLLLGCGVGLFQSPNNSVVLSNAPVEALGVAGGVLAVMRNLGQTVGIAVTGAIWASQVTAIAGERFEPITSAPVDAIAGGFDRAMLVAASIALLAIIPSFMGGRASANELPAEAPIRSRAETTGKTSG
ncbi:MAG: MFS transporter [Chloroflexales bacterium]|nr:MFS transporter [Chloroflexales bacterium]